MKLMDSFMMGNVYDYYSHPISPTCKHCFDVKPKVILCSDLKFIQCILKHFATCCLLIC